MKILILGIALALLAGCESITVKADANIDLPVSSYHQDKSIRAKEKDPYPYLTDRKPLSSFRQMESVWVVGGQFHKSPACKIAFKQNGGSFESFDDANIEKAKPCRYCIDITK